MFAAAHTQLSYICYFAPNIQTFEAICGQHPLKFADNMYEVLMAKRPPTLDFFGTLPKPNKSNPVWGVYAILMEKANHPAKLYVGSGTNADHGVVTRLRDYKRETLLPQLVLKALQEGYSISHAGLLCWCAMPKPGQAPIARLRVITVKATMAFVFFAGRPCKMDVLWDDMLPWTRDEVSWQPLCTHTAFLEKPIGEVSFTMDDLSNPYQSAGKGDDEITGSSSKSDVGLCDRASAILPTNKDVARRQLCQMMNAIMSAQTQEEKQSAKTKLVDWVRRTGEANPLFESNRHICKLLLAKEVISIEDAELALHEMKTLWPEAFNDPNATIFTAEFIQQLSTLLVSSRDEMSIHYGQLGRVLCLLTVISPEDDKPTGQKLRLVMNTLRRQDASAGYPTTSHTQSNLKSLTSTQLVQHINLQIDIMVDTFKRVMARLTSRAAAANNGTTTMPPAPDFNVLAKLADRIGYDEAARIAEEAYSLLVALMGDVFSAVFEDPLKEIKTFGETFLNQHADDDKADGRENDKTNDRTNSALFVNDDIYNP
ncbi:hypothetical protein K4K50_011982 [Colletotrichum sp. SAR 10_71]|nr:hypothetical protein K4K50_011982 [Colletotrichum sp. SAR 10_71]